MIKPIATERPRTLRNEITKSAAVFGTHDQRHNLPVATTLPRGVIAVGIAGYAVVLGMFWITFGSDYATAYVLVIVSLFAVMYFGLPYLMNRMANAHGPNKGRPQSVSDFLTGDFDTLTGRISGWSAFVQYAFLPIALAFGALAIGIIMMSLS